MDASKPIVVGDKVYRPFSDKTASERDFTRAEEELNETPENRVSAVKELKERIEEETDLNSRTDASFLLRFLRPKKFDVDRSFKLLTSYYKFRKQKPSLYKTPSDVTRTMATKEIAILPYRDSEGRAAFYVRHGLWNPSEISYHEIMTLMNVLLDISVDDPVSQINGVIGIWDFKNFSFTQAYHYSMPSNIKLAFNLMQERMPMRFKGVFAVNCHPIIPSLWRIAKPFCKARIRERFHMLGSDLTELHQLFDPEALPAELGGLQPELDYQSFYEMVLSQQQCFEHDRKFGYF